MLLNEVEAKEISGSNIPETSLKYLKSHYPKLKTVLTLGENGSVYSDCNTEIYQPAFNVEVVDTTAAGDTYTGYFVAEIAKGTPYTKALKLASAASAKAVTIKGAEPSIPFKSALLCEIVNMTEKKPLEQFDTVARQINSYIAEHLKDASLKELSEILDYSVVYTGKLVKKFSGHSFSKALQEARCVHAAQKLSATNHPVDDIIKEIGYENTSFFRKIFKEKFGVKPLEYRKNKTYYHK